MNPSNIFSVVGAIAALQWFLLIFFPLWKMTQLLVRYRVIPLVLSAIYCIYITGFFSVQGAGFGSIAEVRTLFNNDQLLLAGWIHYLAFDLLVGFYILQSAHKESISHVLLIPCLVLTFMFGPCGYLLYQMIRKIKASI